MRNAYRVQIIQSDDGATTEHAESLEITQQNDWQDELEQRAMCVLRCIEQTEEMDPHLFVLAMMRWLDERGAPSINSPTRPMWIRAVSAAFPHGCVWPPKREQPNK